MKKDTKDTLLFWFIWILILFGLGLCIASLAIPPVGVISESVLWVMGLILVFAGAMFGVDIRIRDRVKLEISKQNEELI